MKASNTESASPAIVNLDEAFAVYMTQGYILRLEKRQSGAQEHATIVAAVRWEDTEAELLSGIAR